MLQNFVASELRDGASINRALLALANCINALDKQNKKGLACIPYRNRYFKWICYCIYGHFCLLVVILELLWYTKYAVMVHKIRLIEQGIKSLNKYLPCFEGSRNQLHRTHLEVN
jgi:hypothetical protein